MAPHSAQIIAWLPFLLLAAVWIAYMIYFRSAAGQRHTWFGQVTHHQQQVDQHLGRIEDLLEQIASKLDKDSRK